MQTVQKQRWAKGGDFNEISWSNDVKRHFQGLFMALYRLCIVLAHTDTNAQNSCARTKNTGHRHRNNQTNKQSNQCTNQQGNEPTDCKPAKFSQPTNEETFT
jgi:hypothetical protein